MRVRSNSGAKSKIQEGCVIFDFKDVKDLCLLCYKCQSVDRVVNLIGDFEFKDFFNDFKKFVEKSDFGKWFDKLKKFRVECIRLGTHDFRSVDVEAKAGEIILKKNKDIKASMKDYDIVFFVYIVGNKCYFGVDFAGFELNKRDYKIFLHTNSLRGTIGYALVMESGFKKKEVLLDPFSRDGVIPIEAGFFATDFPYNYYKKDRFAFLKLKLGIDIDKFFKGVDKKIKKVKTGIHSYDHLFKYVDNSKKNAKIAGLDKQIKFSRTELEWLDIKFTKESVDRVVANPTASRHADLDKIYNEFFYQCEYILKKNGTIALIAEKPDLLIKYASKHNFAVSKEKEVWSGAKLMKIVTFKKALLINK